MDDFELLQYFHQYRRLVRRSAAAPLTHSCGGEYTTRLNLMDKLMLTCSGCGTDITPGLGMIAQVQWAVDKDNKRV